MKKYISVVIAALVLCGGLIVGATGQAQVNSGSQVSVPGVASGYTIIPGGSIDPGDEIVQLNNLTLQNTPGNGLPNMLYASYTPGMYCTQFRSTDSYGSPIACPTIAPNVLYQIKVDASTGLLLRSRQRASINDFSVGDHINVFGFIDSGTNYMQALIVRDLDKPAQYQQQYTQLNNVRAVSAPVASYPPTSFDITFGASPCWLYAGANGVRINTICPYYDFSVHVGMPAGFMLAKHTVRVSSQTVILDQLRRPMSLSQIQPGDQLNIYGLYSAQDGSMDALIVRDLSKGAGSVGGISISGISGPTSLQVGQPGTWTVQATSPIYGNLSYSVVWGDEGSYATGVGSSVNPIGVSQSATFTHAYVTPGLYQPVFTVRGMNGETAQSSLSVNVGGVNAQYGSVRATLTDQTIQCFRAPCGLISGASISIVGNGISSVATTDGNGQAYFSSLPVGIYTVQALNYNAASQTVTVQAGVEAKVDLYITNFQKPVQITNVYPSTVAPGSTVTLTGNGFSLQGNTVSLVRSDGSYQTTVGTFASNGSTINFQVPLYWSPVCPTLTTCAQPTTPFPAGTYNVTVQNQNGVSPAAQLIVSSGQNNASLIVVAPNGGEQLARNNQYAIRWSIPVVAGQISAGSSFDIFATQTTLVGDVGTSISYTIAKNVFADFGMTNGTYQWYVGTNLEGRQMNDSQNYYVRVCYAGTSICDQSNAPFSINSNSQQNGVQLYSLQPAEGTPGARITVTGSGFAYSDNKIIFDGQYQTGTTFGGGSTLSFQVPDYVGMYCSPGYACTQIAYQLPSGMHAVAVENVNGRSNSLQFNLYR